MNLSLINSGDLLHAKLSGEFTLEEAQRTFVVILETAVRYEAAKVLVDGRALTGQPTTVERFYYGEFVANAVINRCKGRMRKAPRFAYVLLEPVIDKMRLGETVARNRGMNVKTFEQINDALQWLGLPADID
jgi:hypothetical protein